MLIYLAGRYSRREEFLACGAELEAAGHRICSTWLTRPLEGAERNAGAWDPSDFEQAEVIICFTEEGRTPRVGKHVEFAFGFALGRGLPVLAVGPVENIFYRALLLCHLREWSPEVIPMLAAVEGFSARLRKEGDD